MKFFQRSNFIFFFIYLWKIYIDYIFYDKILRKLNCNACINKQYDLPNFAFFLWSLVLEIRVIYWRYCACIWNDNSLMPKPTLFFTDFRVTPVHVSRTRVSSPIPTVLHVSNWFPVPLCTLCRIVSLSQDIWSS